MANLNQPNVFIQVRVKEDTSEGTYQDSLYFSPSEFEAMTDKDVDSAIQSRVDAWVASVQAANVRITPEPTEEELVEMKEQLERQLEEVNQKMSK